MPPMCDTAQMPPARPVNLGSEASKFRREAVPESGNPVFPY